MSLHDIGKNHDCLEQRLCSSQHGIELYLHRTQASLFGNQIQLLEWHRGGRSHELLGTLFLGPGNKNQERCFHVFLWSASARCESENSSPAIAMVATNATKRALNPARIYCSHGCTLYKKLVTTQYASAQARKTSKLPVMLKWKLLAYINIDVPLNQFTCV